MFLFKNSCRVYFYFRSGFLFLAIIVVVVVRLHRLFHVIWLYWCCYNFKNVAKMFHCCFFVMIYKFSMRLRFLRCFWLMNPFRNDDIFFFLLLRCQSIDWILINNCIVSSIDFHLNAKTELISKSIELIHTECVSIVAP